MFWATMYCFPLTSTLGHYFINKLARTSRPTIDRARLPRLSAPLARVLFQCMDFVGWFGRKLRTRGTQAMGNSTTSRPASGRGVSFSPSVLYGCLRGVCTPVCRCGSLAVRHRRRSTPTWTWAPSSPTTFLFSRFRFLRLPVCLPRIPLGRIPSPSTSLPRVGYPSET